MLTTSIHSNLIRLQSLNMDLLSIVETTFMQLILNSFKYEGAMDNTLLARYFVETFIKKLS